MPKTRIEKTGANPYRDRTQPKTVHHMKFRDRDAPITPEGLIFRTYGYDHPPDSCFCDLEYASEKLYRTSNPKALRDGLPTKYYKFYLDGGLKFALSLDPPYRLLHEPLNQTMVGVKAEQLSQVVRPGERLRELLASDGDPLVETAREVLDLVIESSNLRLEDFGVFGSLAHGFHNPMYSDVDLIIYGVRQLRELKSTLADLYKGGSLRNEFDDWTIRDGPGHWNFTNYSKAEYGSAQRRKLIFAKHEAERLGRTVNVEFEPVRRWDEIRNEYGATERITGLGRVEAVGEILSGDEGGFMPSVFPVRLREMSGGVDPGAVRRVVSYVKEFRLQLEAGDEALIIGNLEEVATKDEVFHQITLSYGPGYFEQALKAIDAPS
jgi:predicted nucleotidyltransferase